MACCYLWICSTFSVIAGCIVIANISYGSAEQIVIPSDTSNSTSSNDTATEYVDYRMITSAERSGVVTLEYHFEPANETDDDEVLKVHRLTKVVVIKILNESDKELPQMSSDDAPAGKSGSAGRRRREVAGSHDVQLVTVQPPVKDGRLRTAIFATDQGGKVLPSAELENDLHDNKQQISDETGYTVAGIYVGLPPDARPLASVEERPSIWQKHFWMFIVVAILLCIALLTGLLCCICYYCCRKISNDRKQPPPVVKPAPVEEKMEMTRAAPIQQSAPPPPPMKEEPAITGAPPPHTDDENGWIIPLDQLSQDELDQPDVQISRL